MADARVSVFSGLLKRLKDMLDGTVAEVVVAARLNQYSSTPDPTIAALGPIATLVVDGLSRVNIEVQVTGAALTAFQVQVQCHPSGSWQTLYTTTTDYAVPQGILFAAFRSDGSSDLTATPAGASAFLMLDVAGLYGLRLNASSGGSAASTVLLGGQ